MSLVTWNPSQKSSHIELSSNNLTARSVHTTQWHYASVRATKPIEGKIYYEVEFDKTGWSLGFSALDGSVWGSGASEIDGSGLYGFWNAETDVTGVIGIAVDANNKTVRYYREGELVRTGEINEIHIFPTVSLRHENPTAVANFGAKEFELVSSNPETWNELKSEGYIPYDYESGVDWFYQTKHLIQYFDKIKTLSEGNWVDIEGDLNKEMFEQYGLDSLFDAPLNLLEKPYSILTWTDNEKVTKNTLDYTYDKFESKFVEIETDPFSPMERLNQEEEFEVLMWTDDKEFNEEKEHEFTNEQVINYGKLFKHTLESKEEILDIYVK